MAENGMKSERSRDSSAKIYIGNLPAGCTERSLESLCRQYGDVERADIVKNFGFVIYRNNKDAQAAVANLNDSVFQSVQINVQMAKSRLHVDGKDDNQCYECGQQGHWARECPKRIANGGRRGPPPPSRGSSRSDEPQDGYRSRGPPARHSFDDRPPARSSYEDRGYDRSGPYDRPPPPRGYDSYERRPGPPRRPPVEYPPQYRRRSRSPPPQRRDYRGSDPYAREPYGREPPPSRDPYPRDSYYGGGRESNSRRDERDSYARDPYPPRSVDPYAKYRRPQDSYASPYETSQAKRFGDSQAFSRAAPRGRY